MVMAQYFVIIGLFVGWTIAGSLGTTSNPQQQINITHFYRTNTDLKKGNEMGIKNKIEKWAPEGKNSWLHPVSASHGAD